MLRFFSACSLTVCLGTVIDVQVFTRDGVEKTNALEIEESQLREKLKKT